MDIVLMGYGRMGRAVEEVAVQRGHRIVGRVGRSGEGTEARLEGADVAVDFSVCDRVRDHVARAAAAGLDVVVGTTGWEDEATEIRATVQKAGVGLVHAPNFSLGVHLFYRLATLAGRLAGPLGGYDVHLVETHHRHKRDHPSGTARHLAGLLVDAAPAKERWAEGLRRPEEASVLQVTSIRAGECAGEHVVGLDGADDRIELRHAARGRIGFARGAVDAAEWVSGRPGWHTMDDMLADRLAGAVPAETRGER